MTIDSPGGYLVPEHIECEIEVVVFQRLTWHYVAGELAGSDLITGWAG